MSKELEYLEEESYYNCTDLGLCAFLVTLKFELVNIDKTNPKRASFIFPESDSLQQVIKQYWPSQERLFFDNLKSLKSRLYSE